MGEYNDSFLKREFVGKYAAIGAEKFYKTLLMYSLNKILTIEKGESVVTYPDLELLNISDQLYLLYKREGDDNVLELNKMLRKLAHKMNRILIKKGLSKKSDKFLRLIK